MKCEVLRVDAFTTIPGQGNPAGVVLAGDTFSTDEMQKIAKKVGFNETVFICKSELAAMKLRYFTPGFETPLCGHATMGAVFALSGGKKDHQFEIETAAGILLINYKAKDKKITMHQAPPKFIDFGGDKEALCHSLDIKIEDLHPKLPIQYGNTGSWTLLLPVKNEQILDKMKPDAAQFPIILKELPKSSVHPFAIISEEESIFYARHFSSPFAETKEDSVTGTASGVMGAYSLNHLYVDEEFKDITIYQGRHVNREGSVFVHVEKDKEGTQEVSVSGTACFNGKFEVEIEED